MVNPRQYSCCMLLYVHSSTQQAVVRTGYQIVLPRHQYEASFSDKMQQCKWERQKHCAFRRSGPNASGSSGNRSGGGSSSSSSSSSRAAAAVTISGRHILENKKQHAGSAQRNNYKSTTVNSFTTFTHFKALQLHCFTPSG